MGVISVVQLPDLSPKSEREIRCKPFHSLAFKEGAIFFTALNCHENRHANLVAFYQFYRSGKNSDSLYALALARSRG
jgi:hypothetical protein